jgi:hypothetical protein
VLSVYSSAFSEMGCFPTHLPRLVQALLAHFKFQGSSFCQAILVRGEWQPVARSSPTAVEDFWPGFTLGTM